MRLSSNFYLWSIFLVTTTFNSVVAVAQDNNCGPLNDSKAVLDCALKTHPKIQRSDASTKQGEELENVASQRPNPELSSKAVYGKNLGDVVVSTEFNLSHTWEVGGKRSARIEKANSERNQLGAEALKSKEEVYIEVLGTLYRIRQVHSEIAALNEALQTFSKIQRQYKSRPKLSPEQQVSLGIFELAEGDYKLRRTQLEEDETRLEKTIEIAIGQKFPHVDKVLPLRKKSWPKLSANPDKNLEGSEWKLALNEVKLAQAEVQLAKSESWPDIKLGPTLQTQTEGPFTYSTYGINISLPLPLFHANGAGRAYAYSGLSRAESSLRFKQNEIEKERAILVQQYEKSIKALTESVPIAEMERKHRNVEALFHRGVISSSLVIEAHRQMVDFTKSQNEQELHGLEALWKVYALEGKLLEEQP